MKSHISWHLPATILLAVLTIFFYHCFIDTYRQPLNEEEKIDDGTITATMVFAGDVMVHDTQIEAAYLLDEEAFDFKPCFAKIKPLVEQADLAVVNLETTLAGEEQGYSGYPAFNTPESLACALRYTGFDLISTANNHSLDRGEYGVLKTLEHLEAAGLRPFGTYRSRIEREKILTADVNGISAAFLAYTYGTNGIPLPENKDYLVNMLVPEMIVKDIRRAREQVDLVILYLHWGLEYHRQPTNEQKKLATSFLEEGAAIIIGNHPHVVQPLNFIKYNFKGELKEGVVAYSLGNLTGDQVLQYTDTGIMLFVQAVKEKSGGQVDIRQVTYVPTWIHRFYSDGRRSFRVLPLLPDEEYWRQLRDDPYLTFADLQHLEQLQREYESHLCYVPQGLPISCSERKGRIIPPLLPDK